MPTPPKTEPVAATNVVEPWVELRVKVPADWKRWLEQAAHARALSVAALVRQCVRELMLQRHDREGNGA